jgi:hypothetical protein
MKTKICILLLVLLIFTTIISYTQVETVGDFIIKIVKAMGLENKLPKRYTARTCLNLLRDMKIIEKDLYFRLWPIVDKPLTKGIMAMILVDVWDLQKELPKKATLQDYINLLVKYGVMTPGKPDTPVTVEEVVAFFENPIAASALAKPYLKPVSPVVPG